MSIRKVEYGARHNEAISQATVTYTIISKPILLIQYGERDSVSDGLEENMEIQKWNLVTAVRPSFSLSLRTGGEARANVGRREVEIMRKQESEV